MPANPQGPPIPKDFTHPVFSSLATSDSEFQPVLQWTIHQPSTVQASITAGGDAFKMTSFNVYQWEKDTNPLGGLPAKASPWYLVPVGVTNQQPVDAPAGSVLVIEVTLSPPENAASSALNGTLTVNIGTLTRTVQLSAASWGVDLSSNIGIKYVSLGGATFTGKPIGAPQPGLNGVGNIQQFEHGMLWDVPNAGTFFISVQLYAKWNDPIVQGFLGTPAEDTFATAEGGQAQRFSGGLIVARPGPSTFYVHGAIYGRYAQMFDATAPHVAPEIGWPTMDEDVESLPGARYQTFDAADIHWSAVTGPQVLKGVIRDRWRSPGLLSALGLPTSEELVAADGLGRHQHFQQGKIAWHPNFGAHEVPGAAGDLWQSLQGISSWLGYPQSISAWVHPVSLQPGQSVRFQYGSIAFTPLDLPLAVPDAQTFTKSITTPSGTALGGNVSLTVRSDGTWNFVCDMRDTGVDDYTFTVTVTLTTASGNALALQTHGTVPGSIVGKEGTFHSEEGNAISDPNRTSDIVVQQQIRHIQDYWPEVAAGQFSATHAYKDTSIFGGIESILSDLATWAVGAAVVGVPVTSLIFLGNDLSKHLSGSVVGPAGLIGVVITATSVLVMGPVGFTIGAIAGAVAGEAITALFKHRPMEQDEYDFANKFFNGQLPARDLFVITNLSFAKDRYGDDRPFTCPGLGNQIFINFGNDWFDYPNPLMKPGTGTHYARSGQIFIHELTHAWQIYNRSFVPGWLCEVITKKRADVNADDQYAYGTAGTPWQEFGVEQQAHIVDDWYGASRRAQYGHTASGKTYEDIQDPFYPYIVNNIRSGNTE